MDPRLMAEDRDELLAAYEAGRRAERDRPACPCETCVAWSCDCACHRDPP